MLTATFSSFSSSSPSHLVFFAGNAVAVAAVGFPPSSDDLSVRPRVEQSSHSRESRDFCAQRKEMRHTPV